MKLKKKKLKDDRLFQNVLRLQFVGSIFETTVHYTAWDVDCFPLWDLV